MRAGHIDGERNRAVRVDVWRDELRGRCTGRGQRLLLRLLSSNNSSGKQNYDWEMIA